jgi:hypothetical protein
MKSGLGDKNLPTKILDKVRQPKPAERLARQDLEKK